jgi:hypothetical protein
MGPCKGVYRIRDRKKVMIIGGLPEEAARIEVDHD